MTLVTAERLNNYMNCPEWNEEQRMAVADILRGVEGQLIGCLSNAYLTPRQMREVAPILPSGLLATRQPVFSVQQIDGVTVDSEHPLQLPWIHSEHYLRTTAVTPSASGLLTLPSYPSDTWGGGNLPRVENIGQATVTYLGGWGDDPDNPAHIDTSALVLAILNKARAITNNRFDDRIGTSSGADNENIVRPERETWSAEELKPLGIFRNIGAYR